MTDFWIMQWAEMHRREMEKQAYLERLARQSGRKDELGFYRPRPMLKFLLYRLGKMIESSGRHLQRRFGPNPVDNCCNF